ncbi:DUF559 domain-containing protein [Brachybacterium sp. EF45031]|uniref:endonuclease domain-containing protein n=1 Tax=Brachybacterium sillae TaxID=2810536 RepID=UPI00217D910B|nr:DUF559 domain-containing protein [Brachybacterium sillae]MCS6711555.1 DUF559 domain-containing protein [Brachybacterium sillae]
MEIADPVVVLQQISGKLTDLELVQCCDALVSDRTGPPLVPLAMLKQRATALTGRGSRRVRAAVEAARERVWSPAETAVRLLLAEEGFPEPETNVVVVDPDTREVFVVDLLYRAVHVVIEYDGDLHRVDRRQWQRDRHKDEVLHRLGYVVLRITAADLRNPFRFLRRLRGALARAGEVGVAS